MTEEEIFHNNFRCPSCFLRWHITSNEEKEYDTEKTCDFCLKNPNSLELLLRQFDILEETRVSDFPKVLRHLLQHIDLR